MSEKDISEINIIYDINKENKENIKIFGEEFVKNNINNCKMIVNNKEYKISERFNLQNYNQDKFIIKLKGFNNITNTSYMFNDCSSLISLSDISNWDLSKLKI